MSIANRYMHQPTTICFVDSVCARGGRALEF